ncbi:MAG: M14 family zinc carboxypeptidase [Promethearchaeota archaeon]
MEGNEGTGIYEGYDQDGDAITGEDMVGGIDLNRNYLVAWEDGTNNAHSAAYHGTAPFSEPETQTMRDFVQPRSSDIVFAMSLHSGTECMYAPWFNNGSHTADEALFAQVAVAIQGASGYERDPVGGTPGIWDDWMYGIMGIPAITLETFGRSTAGYSVWDYFNPDANQVISNCERVWRAFYAMIEVMMDYHNVPPPPTPPLESLLLPLVIVAV